MNRHPKPCVGIALPESIKRPNFFGHAGYPLFAVEYSPLTAVSDPFLPFLSLSYPLKPADALISCHGRINPPFAKNFIKEGGCA